MKILMSNSIQIEESVIALVTDVVKVVADRESAADTLPEWDSLAQMKIIIQLEKIYDIEIEDEYIAKLNSVANIVAYLKEK
jgi:acyl carrier protein